MCTRESKSNRRVDGWYRQYGESVYRRCLRWMKNEADAWDATQEAFLRIHRYRHSFRGDGAVISWLLTVADRVCLQRLGSARCREFEPRAEVADPTTDEQHLEHFSGSRLAVHKVLGLVTPETRDIVFYRYFQGLDQHEIAHRLGVSEKTVSRKLKRFLVSARKRLSRETPLANAA